MVSVTTFAIMHLAPGGPSVLADPKLSAAERAAIVEQLGLDAPLPVQFTRWITRAARGDLGTSFLYAAPTAQAIADRVPNTLVLAGAALLLACLIGVPTGIAAGAAPGGTLDRWALRASVAGIAVPVFWLGIMLILVFAVRLQWLPAGGITADVDGGGLVDRARHLILPASTLALASASELFRYTRAAVREGRDANWWRVARARGVPRRRLLWRHAARHALVTLCSVLSVQLPRLVGGAAITETVFSWPGMGRLGVEAALARDYPLVMGVTLVVTLGVVLAGVLSDLGQLAADPRLRRA
ncbi:MAG: ABC transporter permease [Gemmatimonadetes bacterium]|nr:ABC transporter permease [Gemmatimonadota bacterium]